MSPRRNDIERDDSSDLACLWRECADCDADWGPLVDRLEPVLRQLLAAQAQSYGVPSTKDVVDEVVQETYLRLFQNNRKVLKECRGRSEMAIKSYLRRVARSALIDWMRSRGAKKRGRDTSISIDKPDPDADEFGDFDLADDTKHPLDAIYSQELRFRFRRECWRAASRRTTALRDAWITERIVIDGWTSREAARAVALPPATVATVLTRMRRELRRKGLHMPLRLNSVV